MTTSGTTRVRWLLVFWLFVLSAVSYLDRVNISIAGGAIVDAYHLTDVQLGKVFSALVAGYALFQTIGGQLADRFGPRRVLTGGVIWWGIFTALTALVPANFPVRSLSLYGGSFSAGSQARPSSIRRRTNLSRVGFQCASAESQTDGFLPEWARGPGSAPPLITYLMTPLRMEVVVLGVRGPWTGLAGAVWFLLARDTPAEHPQVSPSELAAIESGWRISMGRMNRLRKQGPKVGSRVPWTRVAASPNVWALTVSYFCYGYVAWIFFSWFYRYLSKVRGLDLKASAFYSMLPFLAMLICCLVGGTSTTGSPNGAGRVSDGASWPHSPWHCRNLRRLGSRCRRRARSKRCLSRRRGRALFVAKLFLVGDGRYSRAARPGPFPDS